MKRTTIFWGLGLVWAGLFFTGCRRTPAPASAPVTEANHEPGEIVLKDHGPEPATLDIEAYTSGNGDFRTALWTGDHLQVTLMAIPVGGEVGLERHSDIDQFLRIEEGKGRVLMGNGRDTLDFVREVGEDFAVFVPAGKWHNLVNIGDVPLKLYSIYAPAEHPHGTVHRTFGEAMEAERHHHEFTPVSECRESPCCGAERSRCNR